MERERERQTLELADVGGGVSVAGVVVVVRCGRWCSSQEVTSSNTHMRINNTSRLCRSGPILSVWWLSLPHCTGLRVL